MKRLGVFILPPGWDASPSQGPLHQKTEGLNQCKYRIIYGHPEAYIRKLRKVSDSVQIREKVEAVVVDEAHLIEEW